MDESTEQAKTGHAKRGEHWIVAAVLMLGLGSLGPANVYLAFTDPHYFDKLSGWRILILPFGAWLLTGFLIQGLTVVWLAGVKRDPEWSKRADGAWAAWCKLGWWIVGIIIALIVAAYFFSGVASYLSTLSKGTLLIAGLLFMILLALWRISDQLKQR